MANKPGTCCTRQIGKFPLGGRPKPIIPQRPGMPSAPRNQPRPPIRRPGF